LARKLPVDFCAILIHLSFPDARFVLQVFQCKEEVHLHAVGDLGSGSDLPTAKPQADSVAQTQLHGEIVLVVFETRRVAVIPDDPSVSCRERQVRTGDDCNGDQKMPDACFYPWL
jgi:hypothetical protein